MNDSSKSKIKLNDKLKIIRQKIKELKTSQSSESRNILAFSTYLIKMINHHKSLEDLLYETAINIKDYLGIDAVGIRLKTGTEFPYFIALGFPEASIGEQDCKNTTDNYKYPEIKTGNESNIDCFCSKVLSKRIDLKYAYFTVGGSFWTSDMGEITGGFSNAIQENIGKCKFCNLDGYQSVALIPLGVDGSNIGLLQLIDKKKGVFSLEKIKLLEKVSENLSVAVRRFMLSDQVKLYKSRFEKIIDKIDNGLIFLKIAEEPSDFIITEYNKSAEELENLRGYDVTGKRFFEVFYFPEYNVLKEKIREVWKTGIDETVNIKSGINENKNGLRKFTINKIAPHEIVLIASVEKKFVESKDNLNKILNRVNVRPVKNNRTSLVSDRVLNRIHSKFKSEAEVLVVTDNYNGVTLMNRTAEDLMNVRFSNIINRPIKSGGLTTLDIKKLKVSELVREVIQDFRELTSIHEFRIESDDMDILLNVDKRKVEHILKNIISNALKFSPDGGIILIQGRVDKEQYLISITNNRIGMNSENANRIFDKFFKVNQTGTGYDGSGLGMTIVKYLEEKYGCKIWVDTERNKGTRVSLSIPLNFRGDINGYNENNDDRRL